MHDDLIRPGICTPGHFLAFVPSRSALELGAGADVFHTVFQALHRVNRNATGDDRLAITLPGALRDVDRRMQGIVGQARSLRDLGERIVVFGRPALLEMLIQDRQIGLIGSRSMLSGGLRIAEQEDTPTQGVALMRVRGMEGRSTGAQTRQARRDERRQAHIAATSGRCVPVKSKILRRDFFIPVGVGKVLDIAVSHGSVSTGELVVSTYGLSRAERPAYLPVQPMTASLIEHG